jgi:glyoxylase-like metal-dependent hydrolase (beta-lactamase superfamily II)
MRTGGVEARFEETTSMSNVMKVGNLEIVAVRDSSFDAPCAALFPKIGSDAWAPHGEFTSGDPSKLTISIASFVVRGGGKTTLVDTGLGAKDRPFFGNGRLPDALAEMGIRPADVDVVLATHVHVDHVGGHTTKKGDAYVPTFPRAKYLFARAEWDYWTAPDVAKATPWVVDSVLPLEGAAEIDLVDGEHRISDEIALIPTPGHTPAHTSFLISSGGEAAVILGDVAHSPVQVTETGWLPVFDMDPERASESRERMMDRIEKERLMLAAGHFPFPGFGRVVRIENKRYWRAL